MAELVYVRLRGGAVAGEEKPIKFKKAARPTSTPTIALAKLTEVLAQFADPNNPYYSLLHPMWSNALRHLRPSRPRAGVVADRRHQRGSDLRMSAPRIIPDAVTERQTAASDPGSSAWVAANAGSGKTHVLAQRVIRLLLSGVDPARILCITFTKAAAANMANRVFNELRDWTVLDDAALDEAMRKAGEKRIDAARRLRARQLFALALETPGGLKVHTIHAFCTQLLHLFPFEANVAARFEVLDETKENQLLEQLSLDVMLKAADAPDQPARPGAGPGGAGRRRRDVPRPGARGDPAARQADALGRGGRRRAAGDGAAFASARRRRRTRRWHRSRRTFSATA